MKIQSEENDMDEHQVLIVGEKKVINNILKDAIEKGLIKDYEIE